MPFYNSRIRLGHENYLGRRIYFVTICCAERRPLFRNLERGEWALSKLAEVSARLAFTMHAYCAMPDHLHCVVEGIGDTSDLVKFVENFKQRTGYEHRQRHGQSLWQTRYYDHILRRGDRVEDVACYVWWNPVRAGLCTVPQKYPLSGSQTIEWMKAAREKTLWCPPWKVERKEEHG